jgi:hypothetical protein
MATGLPPPPINDQPGSFTWLEWYRQLRDYIGTSGTLPWQNLNFAGSSLADLETKNHDMLDNVQGGTTGEQYHLTAAQHAAITAGPHNDLSGIQGGTATERYHLSQSEYNAVASSQSGTWVPVFTNLITTFNPNITFTGRYKKVGKIVTFVVQIICTGGAVATATAGSTYHNLPFPAAFDDNCTASNATTNIGVGVGSVNSTTDRCYVPSFNITDETITISGRYEVI